MRKPEACRGCPLENASTDYVPDEIVEGAPVMVVGQNPGEDEEQAGKPYVGKTGQVMEREYFPAAQLRRGENVSIGNTLRCRMNGTNNMPTGEKWRQAVEHCTRAHRRIPESTKLIVAQGAHAWRALGNTTPISDWRGFLSPNRISRPASADASSTLVKAGLTPSSIVALGVLHLADLFRNSAMRLPSLRDWSKIPRILSGEWPKPVPPRYVWDGWEATELDRRFAALAWHPYVTLDTEYNPTTRQVWLMGLSGPHGADGLQWFTSPGGFDAWRHNLHQLVRSTPIVFQNAVADMRSLKATFGIQYTDYRAYEDLMLAHAVLWSELPHTLEFIASLYSPYNKLKHLADSDPALYNWGDVIDTAAGWEAVREELARDV